MFKIMLVLDNHSDQEFLEKVLKLLSYNVIAISKGVNISEELIDHFPDVVFASTLGRNEKILAALVTIKKARGKPKLVFVRQEKDSAPLNDEQKKVIDGVLYSPIDPFKLIEVLSDTTSEDVKELRERYLRILNSDRESRGADKQKTDHKSREENLHVHQPENRETDFGNTHLVGKTSSKAHDVISEVGEQKRQFQIVGDSPTLSDPERKKKYNDICNQFEKVDKVARNIDNKKLRDLQKIQSAKVKEEKKSKEERKHFIKTLFTMSPIGDKKD